jgi:hypothetical protein
VTYSDSHNPGSADHLLTTPTQATFYKAFRGWQTPYPQKRQQRMCTTMAIGEFCCGKVNNLSSEAWKALDLLKGRETDHYLITPL